GLQVFGAFFAFDGRGFVFFGQVVLEDLAVAVSREAGRLGRFRLFHFGFLPASGITRHARERAAVAVPRGRGQRALGVQPFDGRRDRRTRAVPSAGRGRPFGVPRQCRRVGLARGAQRGGPARTVRDRRSHRQRRVD